MSDVWLRCLGSVKDGKFHAHDTKGLRTVLQGLNGKNVEIAIREERKGRNLGQNAKLHVLAREIAAQSGETMERIKQLAVLESLGIEKGLDRATILGREVMFVRHTSDLSKGEASKVLDWLLDKAAFLEIPEPDWATVEVMG